MSYTFLAGILIGLLVGGFVATLAMALVAAGSEHRATGPQKPRVPTT